MNLPSYVSIQALVMLVLFGISVSYLVGRRKTEHPFIMALIGGVLAVMPPLFVIYLVLLVLRKKPQLAESAVQASDKDPQ